MCVCGVGSEARCVAVGGVFGRVYAVDRLDVRGWRSERRWEVRCASGFACWRASDRAGAWANALLLRPAGSVRSVAALAIV